MITNKNNINFFWQLLLIYIIARIFTFYLQIVPVGEEIALKWQLMNPELLSGDLLKTVYYLHYQPPFWNLIYGIFIKLVGFDYNKIGAVYFFKL